MTNRVQTIRSSVAGNRPASGSRTPGELYTNWPDLQLGVIDGSKNPLDLIAIRFFSTGASYAIGAYVVQAGNLYRAKSAVTPAAFNAAQWDRIALVTDSFPQYLLLTGGVLSGSLTLPGAPANPNEAATKAYVDAAIAATIPPVASVPAGAIMLFYMGAAPTGWTKITTQNDKALRVVSGSGGVAGGTNAFSAVMAQTNTGGHTLSAAEMPTSLQTQGNATITVYPGNSSSNYFPTSPSGFGLAQMRNQFNDGAWYTPYSSSSGIGTTNFSQAVNSIAAAISNGGNAAHNHPLTLAIQYVDVILAQKQ